MKKIVIVSSILLIGMVISACALSIGYQLGKITQVLGNSESFPVENNQSQVFVNNQMAVIPDDALDLYVKNCASCHGSVGQGSTIAPALDNPGLRVRLDDSEIKATIENGRPGTAMPAWKNRLTDSQINSLTSLIRNWGELDIEQMSELEAQNNYGYGLGNCQGDHPMMGSGCNSGMHGHRWGSP